MQKDRGTWNEGVGLAKGDEKGRVKVVLPFHQPSRRQNDPSMRPLSRRVIFRQQRLFVFSERDKNGSDDIVENRVSVLVAFTERVPKRTRGRAFRFRFRSRRSCKHSF